MTPTKGQRDKKKDIDCPGAVKKLTILLTNRVNLLLVDDDFCILHSLSGLFSASSPLFCITTASSFKEAGEAIKCQKGNWHARVIDIDLGTEKSGFDIVKAYPNFPFFVVLSGLHSMDLASEAMKYGAIRVFDKGHGFFEKMFGELCELATLGFILRGRHTKYLPVFSLLNDMSIRSSQEWADKAHITFRQLARICENHDMIQSRHFIAFYNACRYLLAGRQPSKHGTINKEDEEFIFDCIDYTLRYEVELKKLLER